MLTLKNVSRRMKVYSLEHAELQLAGGEHGYKAMTVHVVEQNRRTGRLGALKKRRMLPSSITFAAGEVRGELPTVLLKCPTIKRAIESRDLIIVSQTIDAEPSKEEAKVRKLPEQVLPPAQPGAKAPAGTDSDVIFNEEQPAAKADEAAKKK